MVKQLNPILNFLLLLCLVACSSGTNITPLLSEAEEYMNEKPDSAYLLLMQVESPDLLPKDQNALWCLLYTQAMDKLALPHTSDSLIQVAVDYFDNTSLMNRKTQAYYYCGRVFQDLGDALQAQSYYLKAYEVGQDLNDHYLLSRLYANLGILYTYQELYQPALEFQKKAVDQLHYLSDSASLSLTLRNIARTYVCENRLDSAICYYSKALSYPREDLILYILNELADVYAKKDDYKQAFSYARDAYSHMETTNDSCLVSFTLGELFMKTGKLDSAYHYLSFCLRSANMYTLAGTYHSLGQLEKLRNNLQKYVFYQEMYETLNDSIEQQNRMDVLTRNQSLYDYQQVEKKKEYYRQESAQKTIRLYQIYLIGGCVLILIIIGIIRVYIKQHKKEKQFNQSLRIQDQKYRKSQAYLIDKEASIARLSEKLESEQRQREDLLTQLNKQLEQERQHREIAEAELNKLLEIEQPKIEVERQLKQEIQEKTKIERELLEQLKLEKSKKEAVEKQLKVAIDMACEDRNRQKILLSNSDISKEEALFRDSEEYIGLCYAWEKMDSEKWSIIVDRIDCLLYIDFTHHIKSLYPGISEFELHICYLVKLKIPIKRIADLLCSVSQTISVNRRRIYTKFTGKKGSAKDLDSFLSDL